MGTGASAISAKNSETRSFTGVFITDPATISKEDREAYERSQRIDKELAKAKLEESKTVKLLLLGGSESGKSTFTKQMRILHMNGFTENESIIYRSHIYSNVALALDQILDAIATLKIDPDGISTEDATMFKSKISSPSTSNFVITEEIGAAVKRIWNSKAAQQCYRRRSEFDLLDSAKYFLDEIDRISSSGYTPTSQDILRTRATTVGIYEICFQYSGYLFRMVDVGGQKTERRKWIHCFDNVTAILFVTSLSEYDQYLAEDRMVNRMHDSLQLFKSITNNCYFNKTAVLLFLNKKDIFIEKLQTSSLKDCFPSYEGPDKYEEARQYVLRQFLKRKPSSKKLYSHFTVATDTKNVDFVFAASMDTLMEKTLTNVGVY